MDLCIDIIFILKDNKDTKFETSKNISYNRES